VLIGVVDEVDGTLRIHPDSSRARWLEIPRDDFVVEPFDEERELRRVVVDLQTMEEAVWGADELAQKSDELAALSPTLRSPRGT
jgi:hypothetical protein